MRLITQDFSHRSARADWRAPHLFSHVERFDFTNRREHLTTRTLPIGPRGFRVVEFTSSGHESVTTEFNRTTIVFPRVGVFECAVDGRKIKATCGDAVSFGPINRKTTVHPNRMGVYRSLSIISPASDRGNCLNEALADGDWSLRPDVEGSHSVIEFLGHLFADLASDEPVLASSRALAAAEVLIGEYFDQVVIGLGRTGGTRENAVHSSKLVGTAREFMVAHYADPISVRDIAKACNVSVRSLQATFQSVVRLSPRKVLTAIRLERARCALERADHGVTVTNAALDAGVCHIGRFSQQYASAFGEKPSGTLSRSLRKD